MLDGLAAQTHRPDAVYIVDNASSDHTREVLDRWHGGDLPLRVTHSPDNLGGAGGFHLGLRQAYGDGFDRIWLMDDDVVPAPDCLAVLLAHDEALPDGGARGHRRPAGREGRHPVRPRQPAGDQAQDRHGRDRRTAPARRCRSGWRSRTSRSRGSWSAATWSSGSGCPTRRTSSSTTTSTTRSARGGRATGSGRCATPCWCGSSTSTSSTTWARGRGTTCTATSSSSTCATAATSPVRLKPWLITAGVVALSPLRGGRAEARNVIRALRAARGMRKLPGASVD